MVNCSKINNLGLQNSLKANDLYHVYTALSWNPKGKRKWGCPRNTRGRSQEAGTKRMGHPWGQLEMLAQDRDAWRALVGGLCSSMGQRQWWWWWQYSYTCQLSFRGQLLSSRCLYNRPQVWLKTSMTTPVLYLTLPSKMSSKASRCSLSEIRLQKAGEAWQPAYMICNTGSFYLASE